MGILKYKKDNTFHKIFGETFNNKVSKDSNLENLTDAAVAREKLGLTGDVTTHNHDSLYVPEIEKEQAKRIDEDKAIAEKIEDLREKANLTITQAEKDHIVSEISRLQTKLANISAARSARDMEISSTYSTRIEQDRARALNDSGLTVTTTGSAQTSSRNISSYNYTNSCSGKTYTYYYKNVSVDPGVPAGTYSLASIVDKLSKLAHEHVIQDSTSVSQCNCNDSRCGCR